MTFDSETQNDSTGNDYIVLTATTLGNIQSRLSREEVAHLTAQDKVIVKICGYVKEHAPEHHPVRVVEPPAVKPAPAG